ncbi:MAG: hypothetical protein K6C41_03255 [Lachnospiraceae bacterium]|nr:hypothetical protein [Lachnospiraceae bacterium]
MYFPQFTNKEALLKAIYSILMDEGCANPVILLFDGSKSDNPYLDTIFIPVDILRYSKTVTDFINEYEKYSDICMGFRALLSLDLDDTILIRIDHICTISSNKPTIALELIQKIEKPAGKTFWEEDVSFDIPLFIEKAISDNKGKIIRDYPEYTAYMNS